MKTCIFILIAFFSCFAGTAQTTDWQWVKMVVDLSPNEYSYSNQFVSDKSGNVYLSASYSYKHYFGKYVLEPNDDYSKFLVKYTPDGKLTWAKDIRSLTALAVDNDENIFYAGYNDSGYRDHRASAYLVKLDSNGNQLWRKDFKTSWHNAVKKISTTPTGEIHLLTESRVRIIDPAMIRHYNTYDSIYHNTPLMVTCTKTGEIKKTTSLYSFHEKQLQTQLFTISNNFIYVVANFYQDISIGKMQYNVEQPQNHFIAKFDMEGTLVWSDRFHTKTTNDAFNPYHFLISTDASNNIYMTGRLNGYALFGDIELTRSGYRDAMLVKWDSKGKVEWAKSIGDQFAEGKGGSNISAVTTDSIGNVYMAGDYSDQLTLGENVFKTRNPPPDTKLSYTEHRTEALVVSYNSRGQLRWAKDAGSKINDAALGICIQRDGSVTVLCGVSDIATFGKKTVSAAGVGLFLANLNNSPTSVAPAGPASSNNEIALVGAVPKIWAVVVGVSEYADKSITPLKYAANDANNYYKFLKTVQGGAVPDNQVTLLLNKNATRSNVIKAMTNIFSKAYEDDMIILFLSSHGIPNGTGDEMFFMSYDAEANNPEGTAISQLDVEKNILRSKASKKIIIADACHSGGLGLNTTGKKGADESTTISILLDKISRSKNGTVILSASSSSEYSYEKPDNGGHGIFSYYFVEGLKGKADMNGDGLVSIREIYEYTYKNVAEASDGKQHPELKGDFDNRLPLSIIKR